MRIPPKENRAKRGRNPLTHPRTQAGFTLIEITLAGAILTIALLGLLSVLASSMVVTAGNRESALANEAARRMIEQIQGTAFTQIFATYNVNMADDPGGFGTAPGKNFAVPGLNPQPTDPDGRVGEILFPTDGNDFLREDIADLDLGMPRDLNGDKFIDGLDHSHDYVLLPVRVRLQWSGTKGERSLEVRALLTNR